jgi:hypothetical protein
MRNAAAAEWILSLVSDNAASTVGDLVEGSSSRGALWFWSSVLRTAGSHFWRDLSASPLRMVGLAFWGVLASWFFGLLFAITLIVLRSSIASWEKPLLSVLACTAAPLLAGWKVARRSGGRDLPAAFAVVALHSAFYVEDLWRGATFGIMTGFPMWFCVHAMFLIAGAILFRRRALAGRKSVYPAVR